MRKPTICIGENKGVHQLVSNCEADQSLCFRYMDSTIPLLSKFINIKPLTIFCDCTVRFVSALSEPKLLVFSRTGSIIILSESQIQASKITQMSKCDGLIGKSWLIILVSTLYRHDLLIRDHCKHSISQSVIPLLYTEKKL